MRYVGKSAIAVIVALIITGCDGEEISPFQVVTEQVDGSTVTTVTPVEDAPEQGLEPTPPPEPVAVPTPAPAPEPTLAPEPEPTPPQQAPEPQPAPEPEFPPPQGLTCLDTPPANDGWGWNGVEPCRLPITVVEQVEEPDPAPEPEPEIPTALVQTDEMFCSGLNGMRSNMWFYSDGTVADSNGNASMFEFDLAGHLIWTDPDTPDLIWFYDPAADVYRMQHGRQNCARWGFPAAPDEIATTVQTQVDRTEFLSGLNTDGIWECAHVIRGGGNYVMQLNPNGTAGTIASFDYTATVIEFPLIWRPTESGFELDGEEWTLDRDQRSAQTEWTQENGQRVCNIP